MATVTRFEPTPGAKVQTLAPPNEGVDVMELLSRADITVVLLSRHIGEVAPLLLQKVQPELQKIQADGGPSTQLLMVTCGNARALDAWQASTQFPTEQAFLDQEGLFYQGLKTRRGILRTLFMPSMWLLGPVQRWWRGELGNLWQSLKGYVLTKPDKTEQSWLQGGTFIFQKRGKQVPKVKWAHYDAAPGDYPNWDVVVSEAKKLAGRA